MASIKEVAQTFEPPKTLNIADVDRIPLTLDVLDGIGKDKEDKVFKYKYTIIDGKEYRIAGTILGGIKALLKKMPDLKYVSVVRDGEGRNTRYQVIPVIEGVGRF